MTYQEKNKKKVNKFPIKVNNSVSGGGLLFTLCSLTYF